MIIVRNVESNERDLINEIVSIHLNTFTGFFLTFMGRGFLNQMYRSYCDYPEAGLFVAEEHGKPLGFLAYASDFSGLYKFMIKNRLISFAWYGMGAILRKPSAFMHIIRGFLKPKESKREEDYVELASIGVDPAAKSRGIGSAMIAELKKKVDFRKYAYITLETDAVNNEVAIRFYEKNGFKKERLYETPEGRKMFEFRWYGEENEDSIFGRIL